MGHMFNTSLVYNCTSCPYVCIYVFTFVGTVFCVHNLDICSTCLHILKIYSHTHVFLCFLSPFSFSPFFSLPSPLQSSKIIKWKLSISALCYNRLLGFPVQLLTCFPTSKVNPLQMSRFPLEFILGFGEDFQKTFFFFFFFFFFFHLWDAHFCCN